MAKATVRIFKNHGFKQINRNIEELKFTLLNYNTVSFLRKIRQEKPQPASEYETNKFSGRYSSSSLLSVHPRPTTHGFAYYDLDRLYDTIPSLFYDDTDYTPEGRLCWTDERYRTKVERAGA